MLISQAIFPTSTVWNFLRSNPSYNNVLGTSSILLLVAAPAKAGGSHQNIMLIMWEPLIMQELLISIMQEPKSGRSWTSKVFNTVITLDTYQFLGSIITYLNNLYFIDSFQQPFSSFWYVYKWNYES